MMTNPQRAVFFDRDGVLNKDTGYVHKPADFQWVDGAIEAIHSVRRLGFHAIVVTNQSGVARGYYSEDAVLQLHEWMNAELQHNGPGISAFYYCPYYKDGTIPTYVADDHPDRKPNPGMILKGIRDFQIRPELSYMVGDRESDIEAARRAGVHGLLFQGGNLCEFLMPHLSADHRETSAAAGAGHFDAGM